MTVLYSRCQTRRDPQNACCAVQRQSAIQILARQARTRTSTPAYRLRPAPRFNRWNRRRHVSVAGIASQILNRKELFGVAVWTKKPGTLNPCQGTIFFFGEWVPQARARPFAKSIPIWCILHIAFLNTLLHPHSLGYAVFPLALASLAGH